KCGRVSHARLAVTGPFHKEYEVTGYERAASTPAGGVELPFYYAENVTDVHLAQVKGCAVLINGRLRRKDYEKLRKAGAAAVLTFSGTTIDRRNETDCDIRKLRETLTDDFGAIPALNMRAADAAEMVRRGAKTVHIELTGEDYDGVSHNVCAVIEGREKPEEIISFGAHYDSVYFSTGVYDNMSGSVIILELARYFAAHPPRRTMKFNWYGSEEQGLLGSKAWVAAHEDELAKHVLMINLDVAAPTLGKNVAPVLATEAAVSYVDGLMKELGVPCETKLDIYSSDCIPFADRGVPAVNLCRFGAEGANYIHDRRDNLRSGYLDEKALDITLQQALYLAQRVDGAATFPIERKIADEIRTKVDDYLFKKKDKAQ
ncbi:MAG: M28 family metallopeptidase, partial [Aristaeellaceae bacterium]